MNGAEGGGLTLVGLRKALHVTHDFLGRLIGKGCLRVSTLLFFEGGEHCFQFLRKTLPPSHSEPTPQTPVNPPLPEHPPYPLRRILPPRLTFKTSLGAAGGGGFSCAGKWAANGGSCCCTIGCAAAR